MERPRQRRECRLARAVSLRAASGAEGERKEVYRGHGPPSLESPLWKAGTEDPCLRCGGWRSVGKPQAGSSQRLPLGGWADRCKVLSGWAVCLSQIKVGCLSATSRSSLRGLSQYFLPEEQGPGLPALRIMTVGTFTGRGSWKLSISRWLFLHEQVSGPLFRNCQWGRELGPRIPPTWPSCLWDLKQCGGRAG